MIKKDLISVIIPTFNESAVIGRLLRSIKSQSYSNVEVIVVDDGSSDTTISISRKFTKKVFGRKHAERSVQRNFGANKSKGKFLFFLDADMELSQNVIKECVEVCVKNKNVGGVIAPEESVANSFWEKVKAFERSFYNIEGDNFIDAARFFRRDVFEKAGGYDETITGPEDWDLPEAMQKRGYKIDRVKSKIFHHERVPTLYSLVKKKYFYALKSHRYLKKQNISILGPKTVYLLRPVFYKNWRKMFSHPFLSTMMFVMLFAEMVGGGMGFIVGKIKNI